MKYIQHSRNQERDLEIKFYSDKGTTYTEISRKVGGVTPQRVKQIIDGYGWERPGTVSRKQRTERMTQERKSKFGEHFVDELKQDDFYKATRKKFFAKKSNARNSGIPFEISYGDLEYPIYCPMLGTKLNYFADKISNDSPSFDRIDPAKGYTKENTIICSFLANKIKTDANTDEIFKVWRWLKDREEDAKV